jgi:hypothetical protein
VPVDQEMARSSRTPYKIEVDTMTADLDTFERRLTFVEDSLAIQSLQNRYQQWLTLLEKDKIVECFSTSEPTFEVGPDGVRVGIHSITAFFEKYTEQQKVAKGYWLEHYALSPVIEIAADGKTAKGTWFSPGLILNPALNMQYWTWGKYYVEYIKEDAVWKILHLKWYEFFNAEYEKGPLYDQTAVRRQYQSDLMSNEGQGYFPPTDRPCTYHKLYNPNEVNYLPPEPPEPYDSL